MPTTLTYSPLTPQNPAAQFGFLKSTFRITVPHSVFTLPTANYSLLTANSSYTFSAKERDPETGLSYFGSRYYSSDLSMWLSVDPQSDKYASLSPYVYCANNPVKLVDPNGEAWETPEDEIMAKRMTDHANSWIGEYQNLLSKAKSDKKKEYYNNCIGILQSQVKRIEAMGADQDNTFHFKQIQSGKGYVCARNNSFNSFDIGYTDDAMAFHEIAHYNSFIEGENPYVEFSKIDGFLGINGEHEDLVGNQYLINKYKNIEELKAYKAQYLYDPKTLPFRDDGESYVNNLNKVIDWMKARELWLPIRP